ncbi:MAG: methyltransferase domain-containing protein [Sphingobacteriia bacterium]|nr:methyltransferase domain-containing protein [Sphingobacteriia bacterium]
MTNSNINFKPDYHQLVEHYEKCFKQHGASHKGVDWPNEHDAFKRLRIMLEIVKFHGNQKVKLLDLGCGYGALFSYLKSHNLLEKIDYHGVDLSNEMISYAQSNFEPQNFEVKDVISNPFNDNQFDFVIMNGVFTEKLSMTQIEMQEFFITLIKEASKISKFGFAFNVMSKHVDYEKDHLFHISYDEIASILKKELNIVNNYSFRADYGLYEFTSYVYKIPYEERKSWNNIEF